MIPSIRKSMRIFQHRRSLRSLLNSYLTFSDNTEHSLWGSLPVGGCDELLRLVRDAGSFEGPIIEIGTLFGLTTQLIAGEMRPGQALISVDNYSWNPFLLPPSHHREFTQRVLHFCRSKVDIHLLDGDSENFFSGYSGPPPALVFLDGSHDYTHVRSEIRHAKRLQAAIICGDDHNSSFPGVIQAVREELGEGVTVRHSLWSTVRRQP